MLLINEFKICIRVSLDATLHINLQLLMKSLSDIGTRLKSKVFSLNRFFTNFPVSHPSPVEYCEWSGEWERSIPLV